MLFFCLGRTHHSPKVPSTSPSRNDKQTANMELIEKRGFERIRMIGDGNCFPRALSKAFFGDVNKHHQVRKHVCHWMWNNWVSLKDYHPTLQDQNKVRVYLEKLVQDKEWVDNDFIYSAPHTTSCQPNFRAPPVMSPMEPRD